uniref:Prune homolog 2 with BCH domain n=1 Tax=Poecilia reticulata TaxID=8081 RepID=A0A3P9PBT7_POERE
FVAPPEEAALSRVAVPPTSLPLQGGPSQRKKLSAPQISLSLDHSEDDLGETPDDLDINVDELDTPDEGDYLDYTDHEMDWEATKSGTSDSYNTIPTYSAEEERRDVKLWRTVVIGEQEQRINMKVIEPYMKVISHGGENVSRLSYLFKMRNLIMKAAVQTDKQM